MIFEVMCMEVCEIFCMEVLWITMMWHNKSTLPSSWACAFGPRIWKEKEKFGPLPLSPTLVLIWVNFLIKEYSMIFPFLLN